MAALTLAIGDSRTSKVWKHKDIEWTDLVERLRNTKRTPETYDEYMKMSKEKQDAIKDVGGYVIGTLKGNRRTLSSLAWKSGGCLDADFANNDFIDNLDIVFPYACIVHSTHKHSPAKPRLRMLIPFNRSVNPEEYQAIMRRVAAWLGIDQFDDTTYQPHRLMYWPSTSVDGEYVFCVTEGEWLDVDKVLATYEDWTDVTKWPVSSRVTAAHKKLAAKQGDPTVKPGFVGAFCRAYSVVDVMDMLGVYEPFKDYGNRWTYTGGSTAGGVIVYDDDKFAYSHHGTDPISGKLVNAFDMLRIHKFGELDEDAKDGPDNKLPSFKAMLEWCATDNGVKRQLMSDKMEAAKNEFASSEWTSELVYNKKGDLVSSINNITLILENDPAINKVAYNEHKEEAVIFGDMPWRTLGTWHGNGWHDDDDANLRGYVEKQYNLWSPGKFKDAFTVTVRKRGFHPVRDYLDGLPEWDGIKRLDTLLIDYLGADDNEYVRAVTRKTITAAVSRIYCPGIKFDSVLVLNGPQGIGKSTLFAKLAGKWFSDSLVIGDMNDKTGAEKLQGYWILELGELAGLKRADVEIVKSFITKQKDAYRPAYAKRVVEHTRQCIIVASTNAESGYLRDVTGNRRFWNVSVTGYREKATWDIDQVDQIWAEAKLAYILGEELFLTGRVAEMAEEVQKEAMETDEREGSVAEYLDTLLPENWDEMNVSERRYFIQNGGIGTVQRQRVCVMEVWCELFGKAPGELKRSDSDDIHRILTKLWKRHDRVGGVLSFPVYGRQRAYVRATRV